MPGLVAAIIAAVIGAILGVGAAMGLVSSQGGGSYPAQNQTPYITYGSN